MGKFLSYPKSGWDFRCQGAKNLGRKHWTLRQCFEPKSRSFVAILRYNQKSHTFVAFYIRRMTYSRNILPQKDTFCKKLFATGRNFLRQEEISWHRKTFPVPGRNFLSQEEISCHRGTFPVTGRYFLSQEDISCHKKKFPVTGRNFRSQKEISCQRKKFYLKRQNFKLKEIFFLLQKEISCHRIKFPAEGKHFLLSSKDWLIKPIFCVYDSLSVLPYVWVSKAPTSNINFHTS